MISRRAGPGGDSVRAKARVAPRQRAQVVEGAAQDGQQAAQPVVHPRPAQAEEFGHDDLQGIGLEVDQEEQPLLLGGLQHRDPAAARRAPAGLAPAVRSAG